MKKAAKCTIVSNPFINNITNKYILLHILAQYIISLLDALLYADTVLILGPVMRNVRPYS